MVKKLREQDLLDQDTLGQEVLKFYRVPNPVEPEVDKRAMLDPKSLAREVEAQHLGSEMLADTIDLSFIE
jgi:hypothetical protein